MQMKSLWRYIVVISVVVLGAVATGLYFWLWHGLPDVEQLDGYFASHTDMQYITIEEVPETLRQMIILTQDPSFYQRDHDRDSAGFLRAIIHTIRCADDRCLMDGHNIYHKLAWQLNALFGSSHQSTLKQDLRDLILIDRLVRLYHPDEVFEFYLNTIPYGDVYGLENVAQVVFRKSIPNLSLAEQVILEPILFWKIPVLPLEKTQFLMDRQNDVLSLLLDEGIINQDQFDNALNEEIVFRAQD